MLLMQQKCEFAIITPGRSRFLLCRFSSTGGAGSLLHRRLHLCVEVIVTVAATATFIVLLKLVAHVTFCTDKDCIDKETRKMKRTGQIFE